VPGDKRKKESVSPTHGGGKGKSDTGKSGKKGIIHDKRGCVGGGGGRLSKKNEIKGGKGERKRENKKKL